MWISNLHQLNKHVYWSCNFLWVLKWIAWLFTLICPLIIRDIELSAHYGHAENQLCRLDLNN